VLKIDLHLHTADDPVDHMPHSTVALIDRAAALGFNALAITLHERQFSDPRTRDYARERGITLIPGIERTIERRHVLLLNFPASAAESARTFDDVARMKGADAGLVIAPHPYFPARNCLRGALDRHADLFDAVEWSYFWTPGVNFNAQAARWARARGKPVVGNSDLHDLRQLGRTYSLVDAAQDAAAICEAIRAGRVTLHTEPVPVLELVDVFGRMVLRSRKKTPAPQPNQTGPSSNQPCRTSATPSVRSGSSPSSRWSPSSP
jgi:predicted metal-dependent phosphoesterase TrpH